MQKFFIRVLLGLMLLSGSVLVANGDCTYDPIVADILSETQISRWTTWIAELSGEKPVKFSSGEGRILTRSSFVMFEPDQGPGAFEYLRENLMGMGFKEGQDFEVHTYNYPYEDRYPERNWKNLILTFPGSDPKLRKERILLIAHLDSTSDQERALAPGADDNASGAAGLLEAATVLRHYRFDRTLHLVWFSGEEQNLKGSEHFVVDYADWLPEIISIVNLDMFAFDWDNDRCFEIHTGALSGSQQIGGCLKSVIESYDLDLAFDYIIDDSSLTRSDHYPFWKEGVPAIMVFENGFYQEGMTCGTTDRNYRYHTTADTLSYINQETGFSILQAAIASVAHLAGPSGACFSTTPSLRQSAEHGRVILEWDPLPEVDQYQVWLVNEEGWVLAGETKGTRWVIPQIRTHGSVVFQIIAKSNSGCQSFPGTFPNN